MVLCMFQTFSGNTALHIVSSLQNHKTQVEAVKLLMRKGADPGNRNFENELPSQLVPEGPIGEKVGCEIILHAVWKLMNEHTYDLDIVFFQIRQILKGKNVHA